jgi:hypothetical protein
MFKNSRNFATENLDPKLIVIKYLNLLIHYHPTYFYEKSGFLYTRLRIVTEKIVTISINILLFLILY